jgi:hypothetical protein
LDCKNTQKSTCFSTQAAAVPTRTVIGAQVQSGMGAELTEDVAQADLELLEVLRYL